MELRVSHEEGYVLAKVSGYVDDSARELFREQLHPLVGEHGTKLILDLSEAKRINSAGLSHLVMLVTNANTNASRVVLAACSPFISVVLNRSKLDHFFEHADSVDLAVERLTRP